MYGTVAEEVVGRITPRAADVAFRSLRGMETSQNAMVGFCSAGRGFFGAEGEARVDRKQEAVYSFLGLCHPLSCRIVSDEGHPLFLGVFCRLALQGIGEIRFSV